MKGEVTCKITLGKSRVAPLKKIIIPKMGLIAAIVSVKVASGL